MEKQEPNVLLLVCNQFNDEDDASGVERDVALQWCVHHSFELVELKAEDGGIARITEALQSNTWSGMSMKGDVVQGRECRDIDSVSQANLPRYKMQKILRQWYTFSL